MNNQQIAPPKKNWLRSGNVMIPRSQELWAGYILKTTGVVFRRGSWSFWTTPQLYKMPFGLFQRAAYKTPGHFVQRRSQMGPRTEL